MRWTGSETLVSIPPGHRLKWLEIPGDYVLILWFRCWCYLNMKEDESESLLIREKKRMEDEEEGWVWETRVWFPLVSCWASLLSLFCTRTFLFRERNESWFSFLICSSPDFPLVILAKKRPVFLPSFLCSFSLLLLPLSRLGLETEGTCHWFLSFNESWWISCLQCSFLFLSPSTFFCGSLLQRKRNSLTQAVSLFWNEWSFLFLCSVHRLHLKEEVLTVAFGTSSCSFSKIASGNIHYNLFWKREA